MSPPSESEIPMSLWLQLALALAGLAFVFLAVTLVPAILQLRRNAERLTATVENLSLEVAALAQETRATLDQVNGLTERAQEQWSHVERTVGAVRGWAERADAVVQEVDEALSPPVLGAARAIGVARAGVAAFLQTFLHRRPSATDDESPAQAAPGPSLASCQSPAPGPDAPPRPDRSEGS